MPDRIFNLHTTDELVAAYQTNSETCPSWYCDALAAAIPKAIDAVYAARDKGLSMHGAGAAVAVAAIDALIESGALDE